MPTTHRRCYQVEDREAFTSVLREAIHAHGNFSQAAGGREATCRGHLHRLAGGQVGKVRPETYDRIRDLVAILPDGPARLDNAVFQPTHQKRLSAYDQWLQREGRRTLEANPDGGGVGRAAHEQRRRGRLLNLWLLIRSDCAQSEGLRSAFAAFDTAAKEAEQAGVAPERIALAEYRALEPLLGALETDGIERAWEDLGQQEQRDFIKASLRRETILLSRPGDRVRAQHPGLGSDVGRIAKQADRVSTILRQLGTLKAWEDSAEGRAWRATQASRNLAKQKGRPQRDGPKARRRT